MGQSLTEGRVQVDQDVDLFFVEAGSGDPIVFVPGFTMDNGVFRGQFDGLSDTNRVIALDPRSQGRSTQSRDRNTYRQQGGDIAAFLEALDLHRVALCGWSFGGLAAYECVAAQGIDRLRALVIIDMTPKPLGSGSDGEWSDGDVEIYTDGMAVGLIRDQVAFVRAGLDSMLSRAPTAADREWFERMQLQTPPETAISLLMSATLSDYSETARRIDGTLPVANVVRDDWMAQAGPWLSAHAPHSAVWTMQSHLGFWEDPVDFNEQLRRFLARSSVHI